MDELNTEPTGDSLGYAVPDAEPLEYSPTEEQRKRISYVKERYDRWRQDRQPHDRQWFINASYARSNQNVDTNLRYGQITKATDTPTHRVRIVCNLILPKLRARRSKFVKSRPTWLVVPASPDQDDKMNARATQKALDYQWRRLNLEHAHLDAVLWGEVCGRGYWWIYWDPATKGRVSIPNEQTGQPTVQEAQLGDVAIEVGSPFELLVPDNSKNKISDQPEIMRVKLRPVDEMKARYPDFAPYFTPTSEDLETFKYEKQIGSMNSTGYSASSGLSKKDSSEQNKTIVMELFQKPSADMPNGRYSCVVGEILVADRPELPYGFSDMQNPYPVIEFVDMPLAGQFYGTTLIEQLIGVQREYNLLKSKLAEHIRLNVNPKLLTAAQHQLAEGSYNTEPNEVITYVARPGIPPPGYLLPPPISQDVWRALDLIHKEFEDISQIFPSVEGKVGTASSGFQTNLLQEAADAVHAPDMRLHDMAIQEAALKFRRLMKLGYDIPRLITAIGKDFEPDILEFSEAEIDENANIIVEAGSALPNTKYARIDAVMNMFEKQLLGDPADPDTKRRALSMMELGSTDDAYDFSRRDIDRARVENSTLVAGGQPQLPMFYDNHKLHYDIHADQMKAMETDNWPPEQKLAMLAHIIKHAEFMNPQSAAQLALEYNLVQILKPTTQMLIMQQQQAQMGAPPQGQPPGPVVSPPTG